MKHENFVATIEDIKKLATQHWTGSTTVTKTRGMYLKMLVATTQDELKGTKEVTLQMQLNSLEIVHKRWKTAVAEVVITPDIAKDPKLKQEEKSRRALERNRRTNFSRVAYSLLRSWIKTPGNSFMGLTPAKVTANKLVDEIVRTAATGVLDLNRERAMVAKLMDKLLARVKRFDYEEAKMMLTIASGRISNELFQMIPKEKTTEHSKMDDNGYRDLPGQAGRRSVAQEARRATA